MRLNLYAELAKTIGVEGSDKLVQEHGGACLYIPRYHPDHALTELLGETVAKKLCDTYHGSPLTIPSCAEIERQKRNEAIVRAKQAGQTVRQMTRQFRLTERHIRHILKAHQMPAEANTEAA